MPWLKNNAGLLQLKFYFHSFGHFFWLWWHCTHQNILLNLGTWLHRCNKVRRGKKNEQPCSQTGCKQAKGQARLSKVCASEMSVIIPHYTTTATTVDQSWTQKLVDKLWWMVATDSLGSIFIVHIKVNFDNLFKSCLMVWLLVFLFAMFPDLRN